MQTSIDPEVKEVTELCILHESPEFNFELALALGFLDLGWLRRDTDE